MFFDLDGTLADTIPVLYGVYLDFLREYGVEGSRAEFDELNGPSLPEVVAILRARYELPEGNETLLTGYANRLSDIYATGAKPFPEADATLRALKAQGRHLLLASSAPGEKARAFVQRQGWDELIEAYASGDEVVRAKPNPAVYRLALRKAEAESADAVAVEDTPKGIAAAMSAGIAAIGITQTHDAALLRTAGAAQTIRRLDELPDLLESL